MMLALVFVPLIGGEAYAPLMMEQLAELGVQPIYAEKASDEDAVALGGSRLLTGHLMKHGAQYFMTMTLRDPVEKKELAKTETNWIGSEHTELELKQEMRLLLEGKRFYVHEVKVEPQLIMTEEPRFRPIAYTLFGVGAAGIVTGVTLFALSNVWRAQYQDIVDHAVMGQPADGAQLQTLRARANTAALASYIAFGIGTAILGAGIGLFIAGQPKFRVGLGEVAGAF